MLISMTYNLHSGITSAYSSYLVKAELRHDRGVKLKSDLVTTLTDQNCERVGFDFQRSLSELPGPAVRFLGRQPPLAQDPDCGLSPNQLTGQEKLGVQSDFSEGQLIACETGIDQSFPEIDMSLPPQLQCRTVPSGYNVELLGRERCDDFRHFRGHTERQTRDTPIPFSGMPCEHQQLSHQLPRNFVRPHRQTRRVSPRLFRTLRRRPPPNLICKVHIQDHERKSCGTLDDLSIEPRPKLSIPGSGFFQKIECPRVQLDRHLHGVAPLPSRRRWRVRSIGLRIVLLRVEHIDFQ